MAMPSPEDIEWMEAHINESKVPDVIACCTISTLIAALTVALRIWSRFQGSPKLVVSDWLTIFSLIFFTAFTTVFAFSTRYGAGRMMILLTDPYDMRMLAIVSPEKLSCFWSLNILNVILYGIAAAFVKGSILALYHAIFPQRGFHICIWIIGTINVLGAIVIVLVTVLQCRPLERLWNPMIEGSCIKFNHFSMFNVGYNFVLDILILLAPLPLVKQLNVSRRKRILIGLNFALGGGACVIAIIRLPFARKVGGTTNPSWDVIPGGLLCVVEVMVAIICASLPAYRPLFRRFLPHLMTGSTKSAYARSDRDRSGVGGYSNSQVNTYISAGGHRSLHKGGIAVTDDIDMMSHTNVDGKWVRISDDDDARLVHPQDQR